MNETKNFEEYMLEIIKNLSDFMLKLKIQVKMLSNEEFEKLINSDELDGKSKFYLYYFRNF
jgi:hypothetical protein